MPKIAKIILLIIIFLAFAQPVLAEYTLQANYPELHNTSPTTNLGGYIKYLYLFGLALVGILAVAGLVYGGILYMTSGTLTNTQEAQKWIWSAIAGLLLALSSWLILYTINPDLVSDNVFEVANYDCESDADCANCQTCQPLGERRFCVTQCSQCQYCHSETGCTQHLPGVTCETSDGLAGTCTSGGTCKADCLTIDTRGCGSSGPDQCCPGLVCRETGWLGPLWGISTCIKED